MSKCKICGNSESLSFYNVRERQLNHGEKFQYMLCPKCMTLQLDQPLDDIGLYYDDSYYSFHAKSLKMMIPRFFVKPIIAAAMKGFRSMGGGIPRLIRKVGFSLYGTGAKFDDKVLDVGGGNGFEASFLKKNGFSDVTCIDKFCQKPAYDNIKFKKCEITQLDDGEKFELITFNSSFEHMDNPHEVMEKVKNILSDNGICLIKLPIFGSTAWELYKENWYQIDAPRHYFLYSKKSMKYLCMRHGLKITKVFYNSGAGQFFISKHYRDTDLSLGDINKRFQALPRNKRKMYSRFAQIADNEQSGDEAWFYIQHSEK